MRGLFVPLFFNSFKSKLNSVEEYMKRIVFIISVVIWLAGACKYSTSPPRPNLPPFTKLSNIPVAGDTVFPLVNITWDGGDMDGYITGCEYSYTTYHLMKGDSFYFDWVKTDQDVITIIFESSDVMNKQKLRIRAIDDKGAKDPTPAELILYTPQTKIPVTTILTPQNHSDLFYLDEPTDWWPGIAIQYTATDEDGEVVEYGISIDDNDYFWTEDTSLIITPDQFKKPLTGSHSIRVTAKDNTNLYDPNGQQIVINLIKPTFSKHLLIIDDTNEDQFPSMVKATDFDVDSFYTAIFNPDSSWDLLSDGFPSKKVIGQYKIIFWHGDNPANQQAHLVPQYTEQLKDYLNCGGNLIISGWQILSSFAYGKDINKIDFKEGSFVHDYLHINKAGQTASFPSDFIGANTRPNSGFTSVSIDQDLLPNFPYKGKLNSINYVLEPGGFTEGIYFYYGAGNLQEMIGATVGIHYYGTSFDVIAIGFPMFFLKHEDAGIMASELIQAIHK